VLKPGGRFAFQEMAAGMATGRAATAYLPLPWATHPADSFLVPGEEMVAMLGQSGFVVELFEDTSDLRLNRTAANARRSLEEGQVRLVRGVFRSAWPTTVDAFMQSMRLSIGPVPGGTTHSRAGPARCDVWRPGRA